ncbi:MULTISPECIES: hypothetical protein [Nocardia]|uniref:hypothetical protein n=1 Tax=Nocardia TaxID=1817 RepID=UPI001300B23F|nr:MULTISPECIES: hypothetical protein [Nocardia]
MTQADRYALYAWGNWFYEVGLDRLDEWLDSDVLNGARTVERDDLTMYESELRIDGSKSFYIVENDEYVLGRELGTPPRGWRVGYLNIVTDGTLDNALEVAARLEEEADLDRDDAPGSNPIAYGEVVTVWEDPHGQWDMALVRV